MISHIRYLSISTMKKIIIIYGPTCSGKTYLSNLISQSFSCSIVNSDSTQVYDKIKILNTSPSLNENNNIPHYLFNFFSVYKNYSLDQYISDTNNILSSSKTDNFIFVGGTGMYINALLNGMTIMPPVKQDIRDYARNRLKEIGNQSFFKELVSMDHNVMDKIHPNNSHKLIRAYEIFQSTGKSIFDLLKKKNNNSILQDSKILKIYLNPGRKFLYESCNQRFDELIKNGAIDEVQSISENFDLLSKSVKSIIGLQEIYEYINDRSTLNETLSIAKQRTRNYAKRQVTWFNRQIQHDLQIVFETSCEFKKMTNILLNQINEFL